MAQIRVDTELSTVKQIPNTLACQVYVGHRKKADRAKVGAEGQMA